MEASNKDVWYKNDLDDQIWWKDTPDSKGLWIFSFDKKKEYNMFRDYPWKLSPEEKRIFDEENPFWASYFSDRSLT